MDAKATFSFYGHAFSLYGATSSNHGPYTVALDGGAAQAYNDSQAAFRPQQMLYMGSGLPSRQHTVVLTNTDITAYAEVDYAIVSRYASVQGRGGPTVGPPATTAMDRRPTR